MTTTWTDEDGRLWMRDERGRRHLWDEGKWVYYIDEDALAAADMMEAYGEGEELTQEEFAELTQAMREAREETEDRPV